MLWVASIFALQLLAGQDDARVLTTGDIAARHAALDRIAAIPPGERSEEVWQALRQELERVVKCIDLGSTSPAESTALRCDVHPTAEDEYLPTLVSALAQTRDPLMIPTLIRVAGSGAMATEPLVRFGELAVPALIEAAMSSRRGPWGDESSGAMFALSRMLEQPPANSERALGNAARGRILELARTALRTRLTAAAYIPYIPVVGLALATGDASLRSEVELLAHDSSEWRRRGVTDPAQVTRMQNSIRFQLTRHPKP